MMYARGCKVTLEGPCDACILCNSEHSNYRIIFAHIQIQSYMDQPEIALQMFFGREVTYQAVQDVKQKWAMLN